jgi:hypothetical protein
VLKEGELYFGDNGRVFCRTHAGMSASLSGRDISGQRVERVTPLARQLWRQEMGAEIDCESCAAGKRRAARKG